jgi:hypothetical protein
MADFQENGPDGLGPLLAPGGVRLVTLPDLVRHICRDQMTAPQDAVQAITECTGLDLYYRRQNCLATKVETGQTVRLSCDPVMRVVPGGIETLKEWHARLFTVETGWASGVDSILCQVKRWLQADGCGIQVWGKVACSVEFAERAFLYGASKALPSQGFVTPRGYTWNRKSGGRWTDTERDEMFRMRHIDGMTDEAIGKACGGVTGTTVGQHIGPKRGWSFDTEGVKGWRSSTELRQQCGLKLGPLKR